MTISLDENTLVHTIWFLGAEENQFDVLGALYKPKDEPWQLVYRFRYYSGTSDPHDGTDRKSWTQIIDDGRGPEAIAATFADIMAGLRKVLPSTAYLDTLRIDGDGDAAMKAMAARPWSHLSAEGDA